VAIEQAVFASARTQRGDGYQVIAASRGASAEVLRQLAAQCPAHDSLNAGCGSAGSVNCWPLAGGAVCVSRTLPAGHEYSGRGGANVRTVCLIVPASDHARFAWNAFGLLRAAEASGQFAGEASTPDVLPSLELRGTTALVDRMLLAQVAAKREVRVLALLVDRLLTCAWLTVVGAATPQRRDSACAADRHDAGAAPRLCAAAINCLPLALRSNLSFSTALVPSLSRPLRLVFADRSARPSRTAGATTQNLRGLDAGVLDLSEPDDGAELGGWSRFVSESIAGGHVGRLAAQIKRLSVERTPGDTDRTPGNIDPVRLNELGTRLLIQAESHEAESPVESGHPTSL